jgi:hypothetical protein
MNREELSEAVHDLASTTHMARYALEHAMAALALEQLKQLFDTVADHHDLLMHDYVTRLATKARQRG